MSIRGGSSHRDERARAAPSRATNRASSPSIPCPSRRTFFIGGTVALTGSLAALAVASPSTVQAIKNVCCTTVCAGKPERLNGILVDYTDEPLKGQQEQDVDRLVERFLEASRMGDKLVIGRLLENPANPTETVADLCDPGRSSERGYLLNAYDPEEKDRKARFVGPWKAAMSEARKPSPQPKTPLVEGIRQFTSGLAFHGNDEAVAKRFLLISDLLMNSGPANAYDQDLSDPDARTARNYIKSFVPALKNCEVTIGLLVRFKHRNRQRKESLRWFEDYLRQAGVAKVDWQTIG